MGNHGRKLTSKQKKFIAEYQKDYNGIRAATVAGYSEKYAGEIAYQLLQKSTIKELIDRQTQARLEKIGVQAESILRDRVKIAKADPRNLFQENGCIKPVHEWDDELAGCIAGVEMIELRPGCQACLQDDNGGRPPGRGAKYGLLKRVKLNDRNPAQHDLMAHKRLFPQPETRVDIDIHQDTTNLELSAKIIFLLKAAHDKMLLEGGDHGQIEGGEELNEGS